MDSGGHVKAHKNGKAVITGTVALDEFSRLMAQFAITVGDSIEKGGDDGGNPGGGTQPPVPLKWWQNLPAWLQWILRILLFGWIWMRQKKSCRKKHRPGRRNPAGACFLFWMLRTYT